MLSSICAALEASLALTEEFACRHEIWLDRARYRLYTVQDTPGLGLIVSDAVDLWTPLGLVRSIVDQHLAGRREQRYVLLSPAVPDDRRLNYLSQFYAHLLDPLDPWSLTCLSLDASPTQIQTAQPPPLDPPELPRQLEGAGLLQDLAIQDAQGRLFWTLDAVDLSGDQPLFTGLVREAEVGCLAALGRLAAVEWAMAQFSQAMPGDRKLYGTGGRLQVGHSGAARALRFANNAHWQLPVVRLL